jgi:hypothetical protein
MLYRLKNSMILAIGGVFLALIVGFMIINNESGPAFPKGQYYDSLMFIFLSLCYLSLVVFIRFIISKVK